MTSLMAADSHCSDGFLTVWGTQWFFLFFLGGGVIFSFFKKRALQTKRKMDENINSAGQCSRPAIEAYVVQKP